MLDLLAKVYIDNGTNARLELGAIDRRGKPKTLGSTWRFFLLESRARIARWLSNVARAKSKARIQFPRIPSCAE